MVEVSHANVFNLNCMFFFCIPVSTTENNEIPEKDNILQNSSSNGTRRHATLTRQPSERSELADLLAEHQERQLRSKQGLNLGINRKWGSNSKVNELHIQTNLPQQSLNGNGVRHFEQLPLNSGATMAVYPGKGIFSQGNQQIMQSGKIFDKMT